MNGQSPERGRVSALTLGAAAVGVLLAGVLWRASAARQTTPLEPPRAAWSRGDPVVAAIVRIECRRFGVPEPFALCVADHESRFDPQAIGDDGDAVGLFQFHLGTWQHLRTRMGLPPDDLRLDAREASRTACWAFANGFQQRWTVVRRGVCAPTPNP
jgi:soluble lytic murein transglycosylase-like protein